MAIKRWKRSRIRLGIITSPMACFCFGSVLTLFLNDFFAPARYHDHNVREYIAISIMAILTVLSIYLFYFCIKIYLKDIYPKDKLLYKQGVWNLLKAWFYE